nr:hypothetical protein [Rhizobium leguminosarum]
MTTTGKKATVDPALRSLVERQPQKCDRRSCSDRLGRRPRRETSRPAGR